LEERWILLSLQEIDLERWDKKLMVEQAQGLPSYVGQDLLVGFEELGARVAEVKDECAAEAMVLSWLVMGISNGQVDIGVFPIWDIPLHLMLAQEVIAVIDLILEHLREEHASGTGPWI
jgi:hypothetical protein